MMGGDEGYLMMLRREVHFGSRLLGGLFQTDGAAERRKKKKIADHVSACALMEDREWKH